MSTQSSPRLPFWRTVVDAYAVTVRNLGYLARISWLWVLVMLPIAFSYHMTTFRLGWVGTSDEFSLGSLADLVITTLLYMPMLASIAVAWHRRLLADEVWQGQFYLRLDRTVVAYLGLAALISLIATGPLFAGSAWVARAVSEGWVEGLVLGGFLSIAVGLFIGTKIWLALPARALGRSGFGLRQAWSGSNRNFWRLFIGCLLCTIPVWIITGVIVMLEVDWTKFKEPVVYAAWTTMFELITTFLAGMPVVSFLSLAYRRLILSRDAEGTRR